MLHYDAFGKPYLENGPFFNISHTDGWVVCALSEQGEIGVDVERKLPVDPKEFSFVFTAKECIRMQRIEQALQPELFFSFWTRKEALIKADGRAMQLPLHLIDVQKEKVAFEGKVFYLKELELSQDVALAVATCQPESIDLRNVTPDFLQGCGLREEGLGYEV